MPIFFRDVEAILIVYDVTSERSFKRAKDYFFEVNQQIEVMPLIGLVGNKLDLKEKREVLSGIKPLPCVTLMD